MKKKHLLALSILGVFALMGCSVNSSSSTDTSSSGSTTSTSEEAGSAYDYNSEISIEEASEIEVSEVTGDFVLETSDGTYTQTNNIYKITSAGTYSLSGKLVGQILIEAGEDDEVVLELNGVSISNSTDSPIKAVTADKVEISAKSDTGNTITDSRSAKTTDVESIGEGAIYAKCDLKLKGSGTLVVTGNYNNAIHTTKDLTIQKLTLKATGYNNALKGNNSVTITYGTVQAYAKTGNGIKTEDSGVNSNNKQKGSIYINGGSVYVDSLHDAIDAVYNIEVDELDSEAPTSVSIKTGTQSSFYSKSSFKADSEKGLKAQNEIIINKGTIVIAASDDAIHANYGDTLDNGDKGTGNITINDGLVQIASGDDGLHADNTLAVKGGKVVVTGATEGFEANYINISGGYSYIYGTDDGVNCSKKSFSSCAITISGGYLDVAVSNGDTDGIDSNGNYTQTGGTVITRGSPGTGSGMSTGLDVDGTASITGGTLIAFNGLETAPSKGSNVYYAATTQTSGGQMGPGGGGRRWAVSTSSTLQAGNYTLSGNGIDLSFTNDYNYSSFLIYSSLLSSGSTYTLARSSTTVYSWTQSSSNVTIS